MVPGRTFQIPGFDRDSHEVLNNPGLWQWHSLGDLRRSGVPEALAELPWPRPLAMEGADFRRGKEVDRFKLSGFMLDFLPVLPEGRAAF